MNNTIKKPAEDDKILAPPPEIVVPAGDPLTKEELTEEEIQLAFLRVFSDYVCDCGDFYCSHNLLPFQKPDCR